MKNWKVVCLFWLVPQMLAASEPFPREGSYRWRRVFDAPGEKVRGVCLSAVLSSSGRIQAPRILVAGSRELKSRSLYYLASFRTDNGQVDGEFTLGSHQPEQILKQDRDKFILLSRDAATRVYQIGEYQVLRGEIRPIWSRELAAHPDLSIKLVAAEQQEIRYVQGLTGLHAQSLTLLKAMDGTFLTSIALPQKTSQVMPVSLNEVLLVHQGSQSKTSSLSFLDLRVGDPQTFYEQPGEPIFVWKSYRAPGGLTVLSSYTGMNPVGLEMHSLRALDDSGRVRWARPGRLLCANGGDALVFDGIEHELSRVEISTGNTLWRAIPPMKHLPNLTVEASIEKQAVYVGLTALIHGGHFHKSTGLYSLSLRDGSTQWVAFNNPRIQPLRFARPLQTLEGGILIQGRTPDHTVLGVVYPPQAESESSFN